MALTETQKKAFRVVYDYIMTNAPETVISVRLDAKRMIRMKPGPALKRIIERAEDKKAA